jgi:hypothetical protein
VKKTLYIAAVLAFSAGSANACGLRGETDRTRFGESPCGPQPPMTVTTFSNGLIINTPSLNASGRPVSSAQPFSNGPFITSTGQKTWTCRSLGDNNTAICH